MSKEAYPYVQYSTELHTHTRPDGWVEEHAHRTWPEFHGHDRIPVLPDVRVHRCEANDGYIWPALPWEAVKRIAEPEE